MGIIDIVIILLILFGGLIGFQEGVIKKTTSFLGLFVVVIISFILKNYLSSFFYEYLPFFNFGGIIKGVGVINILIYEVVAFFVIFGALMCILRMLLVVTGLVEKILQATIFLSIPSKILGIFVGALEAYVYVFLGLFILSMPMFNVVNLNNSNLANIILKDTPIISNFTEDTADTYMKVYNLLHNDSNKSNKELNEEILTLLIDKGVVTKESADHLIRSGKIAVNDDNFIENLS